MMLRIFLSLSPTLWVKQLAIRLGWQTTPAKSLVIPQAGEGANVKGINP